MHPVLICDLLTHTSNQGYSWHKWYVTWFHCVHLRELSLVVFQIQVVVYVCRKWKKASQFSRTKNRYIYWNWIVFPHPHNHDILGWMILDYSRNIFSHAKGWAWARWIAPTGIPVWIQWDGWQSCKKLKYGHGCILSPMRLWHPIYCEGLIQQEDQRYIC